MSSSRSYSLEGADRSTVGTSDTTMRIWQLIHAAGEDGLSRDEIVDLVSPHINAGHARRRLLAQQQAKHKYESIRAKGVPRIPPSWESTDVTAARSWVITKTLSDMRRLGTIIRGDDHRYRADRKPRYERDERKLDISGDRTRLHMNGVEALRVLKPALERRSASTRAQLDTKEWVALDRLVKLFEEQLQAGFPTID